MVIRSSYIQQPRAISPDIGGFIDLWSNGVRAASAHITVAKYAVEAGMPLNHFVGVTQWSLNLLWRISDEYFAVSERREDYNSYTQFQLDRFEHDVLNRRLSTLNAEMGILDYKIINAESLFYRDIAWFYHFSPDLHALVGGIMSRITSLYPDKAFDLSTFINGAARDRGLQNRGVLEAAQIILENLIDNAIKHAPDGRVMMWIGDENDTIVVGDVAGGLEPGTPEKLLAGTGHRERRVVDEEGPGIGWPSMLDIAKKHGWQLDLKNRPGKGLKVFLRLKPGDLIKMDDAEYAINLDTLANMTAGKILAGASSLVGVEPFAESHMSDDPDAQPLDVTRTPIYAAIQRANMLVATHFPQVVAQ